MVLVLTGVCFAPGPGSQPVEAGTLKPSGVFPQALTWESYRLADGEFSVELPAVPAVSIYEWDDSQIIFPIRDEIGAYAQGVSYGIRIYKRKRPLDEFLRWHKRPPESEFKRELDIGGVRGQEYAFENNRFKARMQYFITNRSIYVFEALGVEMGNREVGIPKFFDSIKFGKQLAGRVMVQGPGEPAAEDASSAAQSSSTEVFKGKETSRKVIVTMKPEPSYTPEARKAQITGTVLLSAVFSYRGTVENIEVRQSLPEGLTKNAIGAARKIKFIPAEKDGRFVSMYIHLEYNFNLY
jgi:TonB family protein